MGLPGLVQFATNATALGGTTVLVIMLAVVMGELVRKHRHAEIALLRGLRLRPRPVGGAVPLVPRPDGRAIRAGAPRSDRLGRR